MTEQYLCKSYADNGLVLDCTCGKCNLDPPKSHILLHELEEELRSMKPHSLVFKLIKAEMVRRGHWKNRPRGKSFEPGNEYLQKPSVKQ